MRLAEWFQKKLEESKHSIVFITEGVIIEITEQIALRMKELGLKKKDLAERLGVSKAYVTRLLQGNHNMSIRKLVEVAAALDCEVQVQLTPKEGAASRLPAEPASVEFKQEVRGEPIDVSEATDESTLLAA